MSGSENQYSFMYYRESKMDRFFAEQLHYTGQRKMDIWNYVNMYFFMSE